MFNMEKRYRNKIIIIIIMTFRSLIGSGCCCTLQKRQRSVFNPTSIGTVPMAMFQGDAAGCAWVVHSAVMPSEAETEACRQMSDLAQIVNLLSPPRPRCNSQADRLDSARIENLQLSCT